MLALALSTLDKELQVLYLSALCTGLLDLEETTHVFLHLLYLNGRHQNLLLKCSMLYSTLNIDCDHHCINCTRNVGFGDTISFCKRMVRPGNNTFSVKQLLEFLRINNSVSVKVNTEIYIGRIFSK